jgi:DNA-binding MarR family transcriptional regulator
MPDALDRIIDLTFELHRTFRQHMLQCMKDEKDELNFLQIFALVHIEKMPGLTMKELAQMLHVTSPSATSFVSRLEKGKWIERYHDQDNRRLVRLRLTPTGKKLVHGKMAKRRAELRRLLGSLPVSEQTAFATILDHLLHAHSSHRPS